MEACTLRRRWGSPLGMSSCCGPIRRLGGHQNIPQLQGLQRVGGERWLLLARSFLFSFLLAGTPLFSFFSARIFFHFHFARIPLQTLSTTLQSNLLLLYSQAVRTPPTDAPKPLSVSQAGPLVAEEYGGSRVLEWMAGVAAGVQKRSPVAVALHVATWTS